MPDTEEPPDAYREYVDRRRKAEQLALAHAAVQPPRRRLLGILWRATATAVLVPLALVFFVVGPVGATVSLGIAWLLWTKVWGGSYCTGAFPVLPQDQGRIPGDPH
jgi:hypothetical protein